MLAFKKNYGFTKRLVDAIEIIAKTLKNTNNEWCVITSCALGLQGVDVAIRDIDILTNKQGVIEISNRLSDFQTISPTYGITNEYFQSYYAEFFVSGFDVEVFGEFKARSAATNQKWICLDDQVKYSQTVTLGDTKIPVLPLKYLVEMYKVFDREKDLLKIQKIQQRIGEQCL